MKENHFFFSFQPVPRPSTTLFFSHGDGSLRRLGLAMPLRLESVRPESSSAVCRLVLCCPPVLSTTSSMRPLRSKPGRRESVRLYTIAPCGHRPWFDNGSFMSWPVHADGVSMVGGLVLSQAQSHQVATLRTTASAFKKRQREQAQVQPCGTVVAAVLAYSRAGRATWCWQCLSSRGSEYTAEPSTP
jgi:hypothetical protein